MDILETEFRKHPRNPILLRYYILNLIDKEHILEADYYHQKLLKEDPKGIETNRLGYLLRIKQAKTNIQSFEKALFEAKAKIEIIYALQLTYYYTFSVNKNIRNCLDGLLDINPTEKYTFEIVIEAILHLKDYTITKKFIKNYLGSNPKIKLNEHINKSLKRILIKRFAAVLRQVH